MRWVLGLFVILFLGSAGAAYYFYDRYISLKTNPERLQQEELQTIISQVERIALVPQGETPTLATVTDPTSLRNQTFFINAKKGDRVLIYEGAGKAILFDPIQKRIIEMAPLSALQIPAENQAATGTSTSITSSTDSSISASSTASSTQKTRR